MYLPLHVRLTLFYALVLALALWFSGSLVYTQAEKRAYQDLDNALKSRAESVRLGKDIFALPSLQPQPTLPVILPSVDGLGTGSIAIEVLDDQMHLLATTTGQLPAATVISDIKNRPVP